MFVHANVPVCRWFTLRVMLPYRHTILGPGSGMNLLIYFFILIERPADVVKFRFDELLL